MWAVHEIGEDGKGGVFSVTKALELPIFRTISLPFQIWRDCVHIWHLLNTLILINRYFSCCAIISTPKYDLESIVQHIRKLMILTVISVFGPGFALADATGESEYVNACAACHGATARGDGPLAELMTVPVPALTGLSAANEGEFPMLDVIHSIDGRQGTRGHGYPMPVWGSRFKAELGMPDSLGNETLVRGRILSIALYLEAIQE